MSGKFLLPSSLRRKIKRTRRFFYPLVLGPLGVWARSLSDAQCETWAKRLGTLAYRVLARARQRATANLSKAFGSQLAPEQINQIGRDVFRNMVFNFFECGRFGHVPKEHLLKKIEVEGWDHVEAAHHSGRGGILLGGHCGNWELTAGYVASRGYPVSVIARRIYLAPLDEKLVKMRQGMGVKTAYRDNSMRSMIRLLRNNEFIGVVADQDIKEVGGIFVEFFGDPAYTPTGPVLMALASGSPILMTFDSRENSSHRITIDPPIFADKDSPRDQEVRRILTLYTHRLEQFIREHPSQWVWTHRRWRTRPSAI